VAYSQVSENKAVSSAPPQMKDAACGARRVQRVFCSFVLLFFCSSYLKNSSLDGTARHYILGFIRFVLCRLEEIAEVQGLDSNLARAGLNPA
jgi:hypothetical protein